MGRICGILGRQDNDTVKAMANAMGVPASSVSNGPHFSIMSTSSQGVSPCVCDGAPRNPEDSVLDFVQLGKALAEQRALRGPYAAVAFYDIDNAWFLSRDRVGIKPLYYAQISDDCLLFASELKGLMAADLVNKKLNLQAVDQYFTLRCIPAPDTIFQGVRRMLPGETLCFTFDKQLKHHGRLSIALGTESLDRNAASAQLREKLEAATNLHSEDALLLSGGIDSAALAALGRPAHTFHVQLERALQNERKLAGDTARKLSLNCEFVDGHRLDEASFRDTVRALDEPIADARALPLYAMFKSVASHTNSVVIGHGADEILGGYPRYHIIDKAHGAGRRVPMNLLSGLLPALPPNAFIKRGGRTLTQLNDLPRAYASVISLFDQDERAGLYTEAMHAALKDEGGQELIRAHFGDASLSQGQLSLDLGVVLPDLLLTQCDRLGHAHGITPHFPFLSDQVVEFCASLSSDTKYGVRSKSLLRTAMKGVLPPQVRLRAQRGFKIPQDGRFAHMVETVANKTITRDLVEATGLFKWRSVERVIRQHAHNIFARRQFWALLMFFGWYRETMDV